MSDELTLNPKQQFIDDVRKWAMLDSQLKIVNEKTRKMRDLKHELSERICKYSETNNIPENKIKITDGILRIYDKKEYSPLTFGYIEKKLSDIISNQEQVDYIIKYLKDNREITTSLDIKRTYNN
jgi:Family of unknown function (DUF5760)